MLKAIIFDFDGVILDTEMDRFLFIQNELSKHGYILSESEFQNSCGKKISEFLTEKYPDIKEDAVKDIIANRRKNIKENLRNLSLIPGIVELVKFLSNKYSLAITTGSQRVVVEETIRYHNMADCFSLIVSGDEINSSKPNPEGYIHTINKLSMNPEEVIIIEDAEAGIIAGHKAGCKVYAIKNEYNPSHISDADRIFRNHKELLKYFKSIN